MFPYRAVIVPRRKNHPVQKHKHAGKGLRSGVFPATAQTHPKPGKGKISITYNNTKLFLLLLLNGPIGFYNIRRIGAFLFNKRGNSKWFKKWTKKKGVDARIPFPLAKNEKAIGENILCDANEVTVISESKGYCKIKPQIAVLWEVEIKTGRMFRRGLRWYVYPDQRTGEIWIAKNLLKKL